MDQRAKTIEDRLEATKRFRAAYSNLVDLTEAVHEWKGSPAVGVEGAEQKLWLLRQEVGRLSGEAALAAAECGVTLMIQDPPAIGGRTNVLNPLQAWASPFERGSFMETHNVLDSADQVIGILETRLREAREAERTLAYKLARFFRFPSEVRRHVGGGSGRQRAAVAGTIFIQVLVGVVTALIVAGLGALVGRLFN